MNGILVNHQFDAVHHFQQQVLHLIQKIARNIMHVIHMLIQMECQQVKIIEKEKKNRIYNSLFCFVYVGVLMQCLAGLWWDQQRRTCVLPSEVACNPYNIINSQGQGVNIENIPNSNYL